ncbi:PilW family protein [Cellulomonas soli]
MSLPELLISMMLLGVVMVAVTSLSIGFMRTNQQSINRQDQIDTARSATERMSKTLRTAVMPSQLSSACVGTCAVEAFVKGEDYAVQFYANLNNAGNAIGPSRVTYTVVTDAGGVRSLVEKVQRPDSNVPTATGYAYCDAEAVGASADCRERLSTRTLAEGLVQGTPLFTYYQGSSATPMSPAASGGSLTAANLAKVLAIELHVTVQQQGSVETRPTTYIQRITLPNAQAVLRQKEVP